MTRAFQKIYTKIDNITKATVTLRATGVGNDELATVGGRLALADIVSGLLESNCLYNERGRFIQSTQTIFALFIQHIVYTSVEYVASTDFDCSVHSTFANKS